MYYSTFTVLKGCFSTFFVPDRIFWKENVTDVILPTLNGQMGILKDHIPVLSGLDIGCVFDLLKFIFF